ncbi:MAG: 3-hydroxyacyl-CoA dehydrogenase/enoyl-CoA hydratase family protein [Planctomycetes bacterium]|nr:3-hydroxyacyl-CoA dehydrogenase/enoyl-CoA hydratase family protein [Planctomycetota bacterium]
MTVQILDRPIRKIGVIGSGQIGPDIALYFAKVFCAEEIPIIVVDISKEALERGRAKLDKKIAKGVESQAFAPAVAEAMKAAVTFSSDYDALRGAEFIVEAATEDRELKGKIFRQLATLAGEGAILASNSSHLEPEAIFGGLADRRRALVIHYFFPAERNPVVEIVPGADTDPAVTAALLRFYESIGKYPIRVASRYGYALDPIFEGLFLASALLVESGVATSREVDAVATRALGLAVGPFTAMNLTGGNPITNVGLDHYREKIMPWFRSPGLLKDALRSGTPWDAPKRGEKIEVGAEKERAIAAALRGAYFGLACEILESGIVSLADLELGVENALDMTPPARLMNQVGAGESLRLVESYAREHAGFKVAKCLHEQAARGAPWQVPVVLRHDVEQVAVLTFRRPRVLNALNQEAFDQLERHLDAIARDKNIAGAVITGYGTKAFISGADVGFLARIDSEEMGAATSRASNATLARLESLGKPVVCALNGFAFGGGNELAMACTARIARKGLKVLAAQPEPNLGIIPGAGATQRLPRLIGLEKAAELLRTGRPISGTEALRLGLIRAEVEGDLIGHAVRLVRAAAAGTERLPAIERGPLAVPARLADVQLGHLSRAVDAILCRAILEGCRLSLAQGLELESRLFGEVCQTRDMRIGVKNFLDNGPKVPAQFVHA